MPHAARVDDLGDPGAARDGTGQPRKEHLSQSASAPPWLHGVTRRQVCARAQVGTSVSALVREPTPKLALAWKPK